MGIFSKCKVCGGRTNGYSPRVFLEHGGYDESAIEYICDESFVNSDTPMCMDCMVEQLKPGMKEYLRKQETEKTFDNYLKELDNSKNELQDLIDWMNKKNSETENTSNTVTNDNKNTINKSSSAIEEKLLKLKTLFDKGIISKSEYNERREKLLDSMF